MIIGLTMTGSLVMARAADANWQAVAVMIVTVALMPQTHVNPLSSLFAGSAPGGLDLV